MPALFAADGIRTARVVGAGLQGIVRPLAMTAADGVDRRKIQHVKAHVVDHRQPINHVIKRSVPGGIVGHRTREQFVPAGKLGQRALHVHRVLRAEADVGMVLRLRHEMGAAFMEEQRHLFGFKQAGELNQ